MKNEVRFVLVMVGIDVGLFVVELLVCFPRMIDMVNFWSRVVSVRNRSVDMVRDCALVQFIHFHR